MNRLFVILLSVLLLQLAACGAQSAPTSPPQQQTIDGLTIELTTTEQPRLNQQEEFRIRIMRNNQPVTTAEVYLDLDMPAMPMATNQPIASHSGEGVYLAQSVYTMSGEWTVTVVATVEDKEYRATFNRVVNS
jgi:uncharacterized GH25 family protein